MNKFEDFINISNLTEIKMIGRNIHGIDLMVHVRASLTGFLSMKSGEINGRVKCSEEAKELSQIINQYI
ncbi:hypothetical protein ACS0TY_016995 [Phlomoides rotata]